MVEYLKADKEKLEKEIEYLKDSIKTEESINKDSGNLSFLYYQLHELEDELKEINNANERI